MSLKQRTIQLEDAEISHFYLFDWIPGESDLLSSMIYQLKSNRCTKALQFYSEEMATALVEKFQGRLNFNCVLPLPGSSHSSVHSSLIAKYISEDLELLCESVFKKENGRIQQKSLSSDSRKMVRVETKTTRLSELFTRLQQDKLRPIYVDDVLTTGNTLKASIKAIGASKTACVLTLFYRPSLSETTFRS